MSTPAAAKTRPAPPSSDATRSNFAFMENESTELGGAQWSQHLAADSERRPSPACGPPRGEPIFSKGHGSPLYYALWAIAGCIDEKELMSFRHFGSRLEGHPTPRFPYAEAATGSLGQGLGIGLGMALNASRLDHLPYRTYVLLGDSEMAEGSQWEAIQLAAHYQISNLVGIIDVNRLG